MIAADDQDQTLAARLLGTAETQHTITGYVAPVCHREEVATTKTQLADSLGHDALHRLLSEGSAMSADDAVEYATRGRGRRGRPATGWASLTPTERRVVALVVGGQSNAELAAGLFVSVATVKSHLTHIFAKLGVADRRELRAAMADRAAQPGSARSLA
jgi:DNA-binding CsgD family transcriptional regulator